MRPRDTQKESAIRTAALRIIADEGLENLTIDKVAKAANISPRTIYIKYENKDDLLIRLFIEEVLGSYEAAVLDNFHPDMEFAPGIRLLWLNAFRFFKNNRPYFALMQYGKSSPLLNKAYQKANIKQGDFFGSIHRFLEQQKAAGVIKDFPFDILRPLLFSPIPDLVNEYFDYQQRPQQIITEEVLLACCEVVIKGMLK